MRNRVLITGHKSTIAQEFDKLTPDECVGIRVEQMYYYRDFDRYLFCQGYLLPKTDEEKTPRERDKSRFVNYTSIVDAVNMIFEVNPNARICILGSESGYKGSYDNTYAKWKNKIHEFIENTPTKQGQQLVGISPSIIEDTAMTQNRKDVDNLNRRRNNHPMGRFLYAEEVARMAYTLLYEQPYVNRTVIRMHGGEL